MPKEIVNIRTVMSAINAEFKKMVSSLRKEKEYFTKIEGSNAKTVKAKENQLQTLAHIILKLEEIFETMANFEQMQFKLEACAVYHGISLLEIQQFMKLSKNSIDEKISMVVNDKIIQIPAQIQPLIDEKKSQENWDRRVESEMLALCRQYNVDPKRILGEKYTIPEPGTDHGPAHVIICQKPRFTITKLKEMAKSQKGTIPTIKDLIQ